jgi:curved DNA-binding protein CbpA
MTDLYAELGIARDPPPSVAHIRASYRRRAKRAHPDGGGSVEEFQRLTLALAVLVDEKRRRVYDETGRIEDAPLDDLDNRALQFLFGQIDFAVGQVEARGFFLDEVDIVGDVRRGFDEKLRQVDAAIKKIRQNKDLAEKVASRFKAKRGKVDRIGPMFRAKAAGFAQNLVACERDREMVNRAIELLEEHEFHGGGKTVQRGPVVMMNNFFTVGGT